MARRIFTIEVEGKTELERGYYKIAETVSDFTPVWEGVQQEFYSIEAEQFESEGTKGASGKFQDLSSAYEAIKLAEYGTVPIMTASGALYESLKGETSDSIVIIDAKEAVFGTSLPYAKKHFEGRGSLPVRKVIDLSDTQKRRLSGRIKKELLPYLKKSRVVNE